MSSAVTQSIKDSRILVVEDNKGNQQIIAAYLQAVGYKNVAFADDGVQGLEMARANPPDIILLDIMMPKMDGHEVLSHLKADDNLRSIPVLVQTALIEPEERSKVFRSGATDLVSKPLNAIEMLSRIAIHLENKFLIRSLSDYQARVEKELKLAQDMQVTLLPKPELLERARDVLGLRVSGHFEASSEVGGDLWGAQIIDDHRLAVYIVDFSGHGVTAALNTFRLHTLMENIPRTADDPAAYLSTLNQRLAALLPTEQYATMFFGIIDIQTGKLTYAAAAPPSPLVGRLDGGAPEPCDPKGMPLGVYKGAKYDNRVVDFPRGSYLFLYSDALTESRNAEGVALGEDGVAKLLARHVRKAEQDEPGHPVMDDLIAEFMDHMDPPLPDDLSAVFVHWKDEIGKIT